MVYGAGLFHHTGVHLPVRHVEFVDVGNITGAKHWVISWDLIRAASAVDNE